VISRKTAARAGASFFAVPAAVVMAAGPSLAAADGDVVVTNTETIQAYLNASGRVDVARVYEQVAMQGTGKVELSNPVETRGLRNLDEFGGFEVKNGNMVGSYEVDGEKRLRTVSDFTRQLPLDVDVTYTLDGKEVKPGDVVGKSGLLKVQYTVRNVTGKAQEVSFDDGTGKTVSATEDVVIPMVGSLTTVLPSSFTDVRSDEANMAGDGRGGTKMSFTMTLFGPIGKPEATFGYEARVKDGVIPKASISALPVSPLDSPSFKGGAESYKGGAQTGSTLTAGATQIDENLLKLRDGAADLLAGLIQLRDGANKLNAGLAGEAAPGSKKLADGATKAAAGAGELSSGVGQLDDGAKKLSAGSKELAGGTGQLAGGAKAANEGSGQVADGAGQVAAGSADLADGLALIQSGVSQLPDNPDVAQGVDQLKAALMAVQDGIGSASKAGTLLWGIAQMQDGTQQLSHGLDHQATGQVNPKTGLPDSGGVKQVLQTLMSQLDNTDPTNPGAKQGLQSIMYGLDHAPASATDMGARQAIVNLQTVLNCDDNTNGITAAGQPDMSYLAAHPTDVCRVIAPSIGDPKGQAALATKVTLAKIRAGIGTTDSDGTALWGLNEILKKVGSRDKPGQTALFALNSIVAGIGDAKTDATLLNGLAQISGGLTQVQGGLSNPQCDVNNPTAPKNPCGINQVQGLVSAGIDQLVSGIAASVSDVLGQAATGADDLAVGAGQLADGADQLDSGLGELSAGADKVDAGAKQLSGGAGQLADGTGKARVGAGQLADGNQQLADGANQLSSGLGDAADGSGQLADGLEKAADGAPQIKDGAQRLSDEGTKKLVEAGKSTAADYGQKYALIEAGAQRAKTEGMAYGAPTNAAGNTAYSYELAGMTGEGSRNVGRGLGAAAVFGLAGAAAFLRRRFI
jgi:putative membrane protein